MIRREGGRLFISGPATLAHAGALLEQARAEIAQGAEVIDLGEVTELDSSLLAALLAWMREAKARNVALTFARLPEGLTTIAGLYGVADLLSAAPAASH
jgi:phospholipid transport system transporter-binding protein